MPYLVMIELCHTCLLSHALCTTAGVAVMDIMITQNEACTFLFMKYGTGKPI